MPLPVSSIIAVLDLAQPAGNLAIIVIDVIMLSDLLLGDADEDVSNSILISDL